MAAVKYTEWQSGSGYWYCNATSHLTTNYAKWWYVPKMMNMPLDKFVELLIKEYKAEIVIYNTDTEILIYRWKNYSDVHKFVLWVNRMFRKYGV